MKLNFKKTQIKKIQNERASYGFVELKDFIDFEVKRVYYISDCVAHIGKHCHKEEKEFFVMQKGNCVAVIDSGNGKEDIKLEAGEAIYIGNYVWHEFKDFSPDGVLLALSSTNFKEDRSDYIEDYEEYQKVLKSL